MAFSMQSPAEQVASHLREEILTGRWKEEMQGVAHFKKELGVNNVTVNAALHCNFLSSRIYSLPRH